MQWYVFVCEFINELDSHTESTMMHDHLLLQCDDHSSIKANAKIDKGKIQKLTIMEVH